MHVVNSNFTVLIKFAKCIAIISPFVLINFSIIVHVAFQNYLYNVHEDLFMPISVKCVRRVVFVRVGEGGERLL